MVEKDNVDAFAVGVASVVGAVLTYVLIVYAQVLFHRLDKADHLNKYVKPGSRVVASVRHEQLTQLTGYRWVNKEAGELKIPIERAMSLVVAESAQQGE